MALLCFFQRHLLVWCFHVLLLSISSIFTLSRMLSDDECQTLPLKHFISVRLQFIQFSDDEHAHFDFYPLTSIHWLFSLDFLPLIYITWHSFLDLLHTDTEIVASKSSEMNLSWPDAKGDMVERPIPEQYKHHIKGMGVTAEVSDLYTHWGWENDSWVISARIYHVIDAYSHFRFMHSRLQSMKFWSLQSWNLLIFFST